MVKDIKDLQEQLISSMLMQSTRKIHDDHIE